MRRSPRGRSPGRCDRGGVRRSAWPNYCTRRAAGGAALERGGVVRALGYSRRVSVVVLCGPLGQSGDRADMIFDRRTTQGAGAFEALGSFRGRVYGVHSGPDHEEREARPLVP